jgi:hypothetical protein
VLAHVAGFPVEEALTAAPALLASLTVIAGYARATTARRRQTADSSSSACSSSGG